MNDRPTALQLLENVIQAWVDGRRPNMHEIARLAMFVEEEKQRAGVPAPQASAASQPAAEA